MVGRSAIAIHSVKLSGGTPVVRSMPVSSCDNGPSGSCRGARLPVDEYAVELPGPKAIAVHAIDGLDKNERPATVEAIGGGVLGAAIARGVHTTFVVTSPVVGPGPATTSYAVAVLKVIPLEGRNKTDTGIPILKPEDVKKRIQVEATKTATGPLQIRIENQAQDVLDAKGKLDPAKLTAALRQYTHGADRRTDMLLNSRGLDWGTVVALQDAAKAAEIRTIDHVLPKESK